MAINETKRENLLQDATVYQTRLLFRGQVEGLQEQELFVGFRSSGDWSLYVGEDPVFQFTQSGQLRRLYWHSTRFMAQGAKLVSLRRAARGGRVRFEQQELSGSEQESLLRDCREVIECTLRGLKTRQFQLAGFVAEHAQAPLERVMDGLEQVAQDLRLASHPNANA